MLDNRKKEIRTKADLFREKCKVSRYGIINLFDECNRCGYKLIRYPLGDNSELGFSTKRDNDIIIFTNTCSRLSREIFTLAHEIGHVVLHFGQTASFVENTQTISGKNADINEQEANYFAACLLMPKDAVERFFDLEIHDLERNRLSAMEIARVMSAFSVSFDMALNRLENLGKINSDEKVCLDNERNELRVGNLLKSVGGNGKLNEVSKEMDIPYEYIGYVIYNYNHNAIPKETLERALACYQLSIEDINDRLVTRSDEDENLDDLIGGLED